MTTLLADALIETANHEASLKIREVGGMNRGAKVQEYQRAAGLKPGDPWCAAFVAWCLMQSRQLDKPPTWASGSVATTYHKARRKLAPEAITTPLHADYKASIQPGWLWLRAKDSKGATECRAGVWVQGHCGIVVEVNEIGFTTVEGNTNAGGSRDGDGVYKRLHKWATVADINRTIAWFNPINI